MSNLIKTKQRVKDYGEVFTPEHIVKGMCDLVPNEMWDDIDKTFLEPSCGNGNFLVEILDRKFQRCTTYQDGLRALESITGIDIQQDNCDETKKRLLDMYKSKFSDGAEEAKSIIDRKIICGDSLVITDKWHKEELERDLIRLAEALLEKVTVKPKLDKNGKTVSVIEWHDDCSIADYLKSAIKSAKEMETADNMVWGMLAQMTK